MSIEPQKPNFLIIGSAKCGTTALASILDSHPDCCMGKPKEVCFFQDTMDFRPNKNYYKGWDWYKKAFAHYNNESMIGEATPSYSDRSRSPNTARRIYEFNSDMKIVYIVRNPLDRQISAWKMQWAEYKNGYFRHRIETSWAIQGFPFWMKMQKSVDQWSTCLFDWQLNAYREYFPECNIKVLFLEDLKFNKEKVIKELLQFLGLRSDEWDSSYKENKNDSKNRTVIRDAYSLIRNTLPYRLIVKIIPIAIRDRYRKKLLYKHANPPSVNLSDEIIKEFVSYTVEDSKNFLIKNQKQIDFWQS